MQLHEIQNVLSKAEYVGKIQQDIKTAEELQQVNLNKEIAEENTEKNKLVKKTEEMDVIEIKIHKQNKENKDSHKNKENKKEKEENNDEIYDRNDKKINVGDVEGHIIDVEI